MLPWLDLGFIFSAHKGGIENYRPLGNLQIANLIQSALFFELYASNFWQKVGFKGQIISECPLEILDFPKIPRKI